jgi:hypothetical protein
MGASCRRREVTTAAGLAHVWVSVSVRGGQGARWGRPAGCAAHGRSRPARWMRAGAGAGPKWLSLFLVILFSLSIYYFIHLTNLEFLHAYTCVSNTCMP